MQAEEIGLLLKQERGQFLEFISAFEYRRGGGQKKREEDLAREIVRVLVRPWPMPMAAALLVGVEPDKSVTGIPYDHDELQTLIQSAAKYAAARSSTRLEKKFASAICNCSSSKSRPAWRFIASPAAGRFTASPPKRHRCRRIKSTRSRKPRKAFFYERQQALNATWFDLDTDLVQEFVNKMHAGQDPQSVFSQTYHLLDHSRALPSPNMAALLLFAKEPTRWHPRAGIDFVKYDGNERQHGSSLNVVKRIRFEAPLARLIDEAVGRIKEQIRERTILHDLIFSRAPGVPDFRLARSAGQRGGAPRLCADRRLDRSLDVRRSHRRAQPRPAAGAGDARTAAPAEKHSLFAQSAASSAPSPTWAICAKWAKACRACIRKWKPTVCIHPRLSIEGFLFTVTLRNAPVYDEATLRWLNQFNATQINLRQRRLLAYAYCHGKTFSTAEYERIAEVDRDTAYREIRLMVKTGILAPLKPKSRSYRIIEKL